MSTPLPVPPEIWAEITAAERTRLGMGEEGDVGMDQTCAAYFPDYCTDSPGYHGPLVVVIWPAGPDAMSTFIRRNGGPWAHCNSSAW